MGRLRRQAPLWACLLFSACQPEDEGNSHAQFTVRGRWPDVNRLSFRIDATEAPVSEPIFRSTLLRAMLAWHDTGVPDFVEAEAGMETPDVTFAWRRGAHGKCEPFGISKAVAHSGPVGKGCFIHFDAGREWSADGKAGHSLYYAALHELGHVLGLGHTDAEGALLAPDFNDGPAVIGNSELAGLHSLYGGGKDGPGDLRIVSKDDSTPGLRDDPTQRLGNLRRVAPFGISDFAVFDCDGDGDDEILVWRTDRAGHGALMIYHFGAGPKLEKTIGPLYGSAAPELPNLFLRSDAGERIMLSIYADLQIRVLSFDDRGLPSARTEGEPLIIAGVLADADGDGVLDGTPSLHPNADRSGDLDGDGRLETVRRRK